MESLTYFILVPMAYLAFAIFAAGTALRLIALWRRPKHPTPLKIYPEKEPRWLHLIADTFLMPGIRREKPVLWVVLIAFHAGLLLTILSHFELFAPVPVVERMPQLIFLGGGIIGLIMAASLLFFLFRRFLSPVKELSVPEDYFLLMLLFLVIASGSQMDWARNWFGYSTLGVADYREYLMSMLKMDPEIPFMIAQSGHGFMMVLHVFFANLFFMVFPFSKIMHAFLAVPINKLKIG